MSDRAKVEELRAEAVRSRGFIRAAETQLSKVIALADELIQAGGEPEPTPEPEPEPTPEPMPDPGTNLLALHDFSERVPAGWNVGWGDLNYEWQAGVGIAHYRKWLQPGNGPFNLRTSFAGQDEIWVTIDHELSPNWNSGTGSTVKKIFFLEAGDIQPIFLAVTGHGPKYRLSVMTQRTAAEGDGADRWDTGEIIVPGERNTIELGIVLNTLTATGDSKSDGEVLLRVNGPTKIDVGNVRFRGNDTPISPGWTADKLITGFRWNGTWPFGTGAEPPVEDMWEKLYRIEVE